MTRAIVQAWHKYTPFGGEYYDPLYDFQVKMFNRFQEEYDWIYLLDSTWRINYSPSKATVVNIDPSVRYYDAYRQVVPQIKEDLILFMDNDMIVQKEGMIQKTFDLLKDNDVVTIMDTIGEYKTDALKLGNKFCPYWFATKTELLKKYLNVDWGPHMPHSETLGLLTEAMVKDNLKVYELEDDKTDPPSKNLGYYHIRAGMTPAYLLATKHYGDPETYWKYLKNQPKSEYLRHCEWYKMIGGDPSEIIEDSKNA